MQRSPPVTSGSHRYGATCAWRGSTAAGYDHFERTHTVVAPPADARLAVSADPAFRGDASELNPESLLLIAAASCQLLSFLAVAARARLDVVAYEDQAEAVMPERRGPMGITEIRLRPRIEVRAPATPERIRHLCAVAHRECYIANSLRTEISIAPEITILAS